MGLLSDLLGEGKKYLKDAMPGGLLNQEVTPQGLLDGAAIASSPVPVLGDLIGLGADANRYWNEPESRTPLNYGLSALGALPMVPNLAGWTVHKMGDIKILENPTREMVKNIANKSRYDEVRGLVDPNNGKQYWWDAGSLNHKDVSDWLGIDWNAIEKGSDQTRKMMRSTAIDGTPWKFSGE